MRMSDWSSDVCSSDLLCRLVVDDLAEHRGHRLALVEPLAAELGERLGRLLLVERYEAGHPTIGKIFMIERVEDARTADIRETQDRSEEHTSELQSLMRISYAVFCLKKTKYRIKQKK